MSDITFAEGFLEGFTKGHAHICQQGFAEGFPKGLAFVNDYSKYTNIYRKQVYHTNIIVLYFKTILFKSEQSPYHYRIS